MKANKKNLTEMRQLGEIDKKLWNKSYSLKNWQITKRVTLLKLKQSWKNKRGLCKKLGIRKSYIETSKEWPKIE